jgi:hypothetical protein
MPYDETGPKGSRALAAGEKKHERNNPKRRITEPLKSLGTSHPLHYFPEKRITSVELYPLFPGLHSSLSLPSYL